MRSQDAQRKGGNVRILLVVVCLALAACGAREPAPAAGAPTPGAATMNGAPTLVMLGDSLTAGFELDPSQALPEAVGRALAKQGVAVKMINAGVSGATTADGLASYDFSVAGQHPDLLVVALGANDFLQNLPPETPQQNLSSIIAKAKGARLPVALLGVSIPQTVARVDTREAAYAKLWPDLAQSEGIPLLADMLAPVHGKPELLLPDGLHPTARGVETMADPIADFLAPQIRALPKSGSP